MCCAAGCIEPGFTGCITRCIILLLEAILILEVRDLDESCLTAVQEMEKVLQKLEFLTMSEPLEAEGTATSP